MNTLRHGAEAQVAEEVAASAKPRSAQLAEVYKMCYSAIDITTLSCNDSVTSVTEFARKTAEFYQKFPHIPNVASICIYPAFVETVGLAVDGTPMKITSVGGGFPCGADLPRSKGARSGDGHRERRRPRWISYSMWAACLRENTTRRQMRSR